MLFTATASERGPGEREPVGKGKPYQSRGAAGTALGDAALSSAGLQVVAS